MGPKPVWFSPEMGHAQIRLHLRVVDSEHEDAILRSLRRIVRAIDLHSRFLEAEYGLTGPQLVCLRVIAKRGPLSPSELAREVDLSQGTVTGIVDRLARRQYISRRRKPKDRRRVALTVQPAGVDLLEAAPSPLQTRFSERLAQLPVENQAVIATMLEQIVGMMGADDLDASPMLATGPAAGGATIAKAEPADDSTDIAAEGDPHPLNPS